MIRARSVTVLNHPSQLQPLGVWRFNRTRGLGRLTFPESLRHEARERWERDLNRHYYACGCDTGARGVLLAVLAVFVFGAWRWSQGQMTLIQIGLWIVAAVVAGGLAGKFVGLAIASRKLEILKREVIAAWQVPPPAEPQPLILCG